MRILLSCLQSRKRHPIPAYDFWRTYFVRGLQEATHDVLEVPGVDWAEGLTYFRGPELEAWRARTWEATLDYVRHEMARRPIDLFVSYLYPAQVDVAAIKELQRIGIPCVNFFCDSVREFRHVPKEFSPFALHWVPEFEALPLYRAAWLPHIHAPMPCWVPPALRSVPTGETEPPTFIGSADVLRRDLLARTIRAWADLVVRGPGWEQSTDQRASEPRNWPEPSQFLSNQLESVRRHGPGVLWRKLARRVHPLRPPPMAAGHTGPAVSADEYIRITREAMVTIGVNRVPTWKASDRHPIKYSRLRDIEAPMLGACYLTERTEGLSQLYELGNEIESYRTAEELGEKLTDLERRPEHRLHMRQRAQRRALREHSVAGSMDRISRQLGLSALTRGTHARDG
jgi:hypothetical protein